MKAPPPLGEIKPCPSCGQNSLTRVLALPVVNRERQAAANKYPYVSRRHSLDAFGGHARDDGDGHPVIESQRHERECASRAEAFYGQRLVRE